MSRYLGSQNSSMYTQKVTSTDFAMTNPLFAMAKSENKSKNSIATEHEALKVGGYLIILLFSSNQVGI